MKIRKKKFFVASKFSKTTYYNLQNASFFGRREMNSFSKTFNFVSYLLELSVKSPCLHPVFANPSFFFGKREMNSFQRHLIL
jgi:hypothetical protein